MQMALRSVHRLLAPRRLAKHMRNTAPIVSSIHHVYLTLCCTCQPELLRSNSTLIGRRSPSRARWSRSFAKRSWSWTTRCFSSPWRHSWMRYQPRCACRSHQRANHSTSSSHTCAAAQRPEGPSRREAQEGALQDSPDNRLCSDLEDRSSQVPTSHLSRREPCPLHEGRHRQDPTCPWCGGP